MPKIFFLLTLIGIGCLGCSDRPNLPRDQREKLEKYIEQETFLIESSSNPRAGAYVQRGQHYDLLGEYDNAMRDFSKAIEIEPTFSGAYMFRGDVYMTKEMFDQALADYNRRIELEPKSMFGYLRRARCFFRLGESKLAIMDYDTVIAAYVQNEEWGKPTKKQAQIERCCVNYWAGNFETAIDDCKEVCAAGDVYWPQFSCHWANEIKLESETGTKGKGICMMPTCPSYLPRAVCLLFPPKFKIWSRPYP